MMGAEGGPGSLKAPKQLCLGIDSEYSKWRKKKKKSHKCDLSEPIEGVIHFYKSLEHFFFF